ALQYMSVVVTKCVHLSAHPHASHGVTLGMADFQRYFHILLIRLRYIVLPLERPRSVGVTSECELITARFELNVKAIGNTSNLDIAQPFGVVIAGHTSGNRRCVREAILNRLWRRSTVYCFNVCCLFTISFCIDELEAL